MSRARRAVKSLPTWALKVMLASTASGAWYLAAYEELWKREVADVIDEETADVTRGPWRVALPEGVH